MLPDIWIYRSDQFSAEITVAAASFKHARLRLLQSVRATVALETMAKSLLYFVQDTVLRLNSVGISNTYLHEYWEALAETSDSEKPFCRLVGSLGLSPYEEHNEIFSALERAAAHHGPTVLDDLCEAATEDDFLQAAQDASSAEERALAASPVDITPLLSSKIPAHRDRGAPWQTGIIFARAVREQFELSELDASSGQRFLDKFLLTEIVESPGEYETEEIPLNGFVRRDGPEVRLSLLNSRLTSRRFDAARGCFLAWDMAPNSSRLSTRAKVRDQQASRAFAAELLAPINYIRSRVDNEVLTYHSVNSIAKELNVSPAVVVNQGRNNNMFLYEI